MKRLILILLASMFAQISFAGGSGSGNLGDGSKGGNGGTTKRTYKINPDSGIDLGSYIGNTNILNDKQKIVDPSKGIIYYQGETQTDIYFKYGQPVGTKWLIEQRKIQKDTISLEAYVYEALNHSKITRDWSRIQSQ